VFVEAWIEAGTVPHSRTGVTKRSLSENSPQPRHFIHVTVRGPKTWSAGGSHSQLHNIAEVVRALTPVDMVHQNTQFVFYTVFHRQPVQLLEHWSDVFRAGNSNDETCC